MDKEKAWEQCTGIVIHGDLLAQKHLAEENLLDDDPNKGQFLYYSFGHQYYLVSKELVL